MIAQRTFLDENQVFVVKFWLPVQTVSYFHSKNFVFFNILIFVATLLTQSMTQLKCQNQQHIGMLSQLNKNFSEQLLRVNFAFYFNTLIPTQMFVFIEFIIFNQSQVDIFWDQSRGFSLDHFYKCIWLLTFNEYWVSCTVKIEASWFLD